MHCLRKKVVDNTDISIYLTKNHRFFLGAARRFPRSSITIGIIQLNLIRIFLGELTELMQSCHCKCVTKSGVLTTAVLIRLRRTAKP